MGLPKQSQRNFYVNLGQWVKMMFYFLRHELILNNLKEWNVLFTMQRVKMVKLTSILVLNMG